MTEDSQRAWINRAHNHWLNSPGHYTLRQAIAHTAPLDATYDQKTETLSLCIAYCQTLSEAIMESIYE